MTISPKTCEPCQQCQCTPTVLATWRGDPTWPDQKIASQPNGQDWLHNVAAKAIAGTQWQWRILWNYEDKAAERERVLAGDLVVANVTPPYGWGGPVRDGRLVNLPNASTVPNWWTLTRENPWRLEIGCVRCRCQGTRLIFWPIRHDWTTVPVRDPYDPELGYAPIVGVEQTQARVDSDYGRPLTIHEAGRDLWWGDSGQPITEPRPCPPTEIVWWHRAIRDAKTAGWQEAKYGYGQNPAGYTQLAAGWHSWLLGGDGPRESFEGVSLDNVNRITLLQPPFESPTSPIAPLPSTADDPTTISDDEIAALVSWLDDGPPRLLTISGSGGFRERMNEFLARFCGLRFTTQPYGLSPSTTAIRFVARAHELVEYPWQSPTSLPLIGQWRWQYPGATGGEVLYDLTWTIGGVDQIYPAVVLETRPNGSRIVLAPQWGYRPDSGTPTLLAETDSPYQGWLSHSPAMLADTEPTVPRNASVTG